MSRYRAPNALGHVEGREALVRYLTRLFAGWQITRARREAFDLRDDDGGAFLWRATFRRPGSDQVVEVDGMDLAVLRGDKLARNEVWFDRAALVPLPAS